MNKLDIPSEPAIPADLGRGRLVRHLAQRIARHFSESGPSVSDKSLVVGIFGEWGSGKSWVLEQLSCHFQAKEHRLVPGKDEAMILPVRFNPWRFEAEEHLIVPLLMTVHDVLQKAAKEDASVKDKLTDAVSYVFGSSLAFARAWKFKIGLPGLGDCEFSPDLALKAQKEEAKEKALSQPGADLNSCYYDFESGLKSVVEGKLKLLFLVDDIDRCLPERAVQMLEAIKLFLDVPECVFVLGVDDEVVERGICHRYRDYNVASGGRRDALPPITGIEYLEKIVHLPVRLPLMRRQQVAAFLRQRHPALFGSGTTEEDLGSASRSALAGSQAELLLTLFEEAVPPIPRKLVRAAELLEFLLGLPEHFQPDKVLLARLVLLQLFAPEVFRHLRRRNHWLLKVWATWSPRKGGALDRTTLQAMLGQAPELVKSMGLPTATDAWTSEEGPLVEKLLEAGSNRVNFDPCKVLKGLAPEDVPANLLDYFHLVGEQDEQPSERLAMVCLSDQAAFLAELFDKREASWRKALDREELLGKAVDDQTFQGILAKLELEDNGSWLEAFGWLEALAMRLTRVQRDQLDKKFGLRKELVDLMADAERNIAERAQIGRALGRLGDRRSGVAVVLDPPTRRPKELWAGSRRHGVPDIAWASVQPAKGFVMGTDDMEGDEDERPAHSVDLAGFQVSRYLVTNAQYRCFVDAGGYERKEFWQGTAAQEWLAGADPDQSVLQSWSEELQKWQLADKTRSQPRFWQDDKWNVPNHPVVGVSWFEAEAFCCWLATVSGQQIRLPTEAEWEWAARGPQGLKHAWGNEFNASLGNTKETGLGRTSAVGLFPPCRSTSLGVDADVYDLTGNVWEWCKDWHAKDYYKVCRRQGTVADPQGPAEGTYRVMRGGSWFSSPLGCRSVDRGSGWPVYRDDYVGFRLALSARAAEGLPAIPVSKSRQT